MEVCRIFWTHSSLAEVQKKTSGTTTTEGGAQPQKHNHCLGWGEAQPETATAGSVAGY